MRARDAALTTLVSLGFLLVTSLDLVLADVIGDLGFPPAQAAGPDAGPPAGDLSQDEIDYLLQSIGPGQEMAAAIQASHNFMNFKRQIISKSTDFFPYKYLMFVIISHRK